MNTEALKQIIEATSSELAIIKTIDDVFLDHFKNARRAYFLNDLESLKKNYDFFKENKSNNTYVLICIDIIKIRILIRENNIEFKDIDQSFNSEKYLKNSFDTTERITAEYVFTEQNLVKQILLVELLAVEAIICDLNNLQDLSYQKNVTASHLAESLGMKKKSSTLLYNSIVALNHKSPAHLRICNLTDAINKAEACEDHNTHIAALTSLAKEYEVLGCLNLAHEECLKAIALSKKHCYGSFNFCVVMLNGAKLSSQLGSLDIARENLKLVEAFNFDELKEDVIKSKELMDSKAETECLSGDEQKLIHLLTSSPKSKYFLIENLYGQGEAESLDNRLKQLFLRLRKKKKGLVSYNKKNCMYELMH